MSFDSRLSPPSSGFAEVWHAQVLAMADELIKAGVFDAEHWAQTLGATLKLAEARGEPDTEDTYYRSALTALEGLCHDKGDVSPDALLKRKSDWEQAYRTTPHGDPVVLPTHKQSTSKDPHDH